MHACPCREHVGHAASQRLLEYVAPLRVERSARLIRALRVIRANIRFIDYTGATGTANVWVI